MHINSPSFELLNYVWLEGFKPYYFDAQGEPLRFPSLGEALAELQDDFDAVAQEIMEGDRDPECGFSAEEFKIRCTRNNEEFCVELIDGKLRII